jgi:hypothetical protein
MWLYIRGRTLSDIPNRCHRIFTVVDLSRNEDIGRRKEHCSPQFEDGILMNFIITIAISFLPISPML